MPFRPSLPPLQPTVAAICCGDFLEQWHLYKAGIMGDSVQVGASCSSYQWLVGFERAYSATGAAVQGWCHVRLGAGGCHLSSTIGWIEVEVHCALGITCSYMLSGSKRPLPMQAPHTQAVHPVTCATHPPTNKNLQCTRPLDHSVLVAGYGTDEATGEQ